MDEPWTIFPPDPATAPPIKMDEADVSAEPRPSRTDAEIKQLALDAVENRIFGSWQIASGDAHLIKMIFMPLVFLTDIALKEMDRDEIVHFYAEMKDQGPRGINGYPIFMSLRTLNRDETERFSEHLDRILKFRREFLGEGKEDS